MKSASGGRSGGSPGHSRRRVAPRAHPEVGVGILLGSAAGWALLDVMQFFPTGVASRGTGPLVAAAAVMLVAELIACIVPASRAVAVHPVEALRQG